MYRWIVTGVIKLTYGVDVTVNANYGTEFFILTPTQITEMITGAKAAGAQSTYIEQLNRLLISTEYKGDPHLVQRMMISADLEPDPFDSQSESREKFKDFMMTKDNYYLKSHFTSLLSRFEMENGNIVEF